MVEQILWYLDYLAIVKLFLMVLYIDKIIGKEVILLFWSPEEIISKAHNTDYYFVALQKRTKIFSIIVEGIGRWKIFMVRKWKTKEIFANLDSKDRENSEYVVPWNLETWQSEQGLKNFEINRRFWHHHLESIRSDRIEWVFSNI